MEKQETSPVVKIMDLGEDHFEQECERLLNQNYFLAFAGHNGKWFWAIFVKDKDILAHNP